MEETPAELGRPEDKLILIVDDDDSVADLIEMLAKNEGFRTVKAADGLEGLRKADENPVDLIVLDMMLPGKAGYEVVRELSAAGNGGIPVLIVTGRMLDAKMVELLKLESNVRDVMRKPLHSATFAGRLHTLLQTRPPTKL